MRLHQLALVALLTLTGASRGASTVDIDSFANAIGAQLKSARYMEQNCIPTKFIGWDGFPTKKCNYVVTDKATNQSKPGLVILLDPSPKTLSAWILNACITVRPDEPISKCSFRLFQAVIDNSGGQFPVAGVVYEDRLPKDGIYESYGFKDGVTVLLKGVPHRQTSAFKPSELEAALHASPSRSASQEAYGRIVGATRAQYRKFRPGTNVDGLNWLVVVAAEHKSAMLGDHNALLEAWLAANPP